MNSGGDRERMPSLAKKPLQSSWSTCECPGHRRELHLTTPFNSKASRAPLDPESEEDEPRQTRGKGRRNGQQTAQKERVTPEQRRAKMLGDIKQAAGSDLLAPTKV